MLIFPVCCGGDSCPDEDVCSFWGDFIVGFEFPGVDLGLVFVRETGCGGDDFYKPNPLSRAFS